MSTDARSKRAAARSSLSPVGVLLRRWRRIRGMSQFDLGLVASISSRQLSFIETGRSQPKRATLLHLARVLQIPYREQNSLLEAAGYAGQYSDVDLDAAQAADAQQVVRFILDRQEPYSAVAVDRAWNIKATNETFGRTLSAIVDAPVSGPEANLLRLLLGTDGLLPCLRNPVEVAQALTARVFREASAGPADSPALELLQRLLAEAGLHDECADVEPPGSFLVPYDVVVGERRTQLFSASLTLGAPGDIVLQETRVECFFPLADALGPNPAPSFRVGTG